MRTIELEQATAPLSDYVRKNRRTPLVVMRSGKPAAALLPLKKGDWESFSLGTNPHFIAIIERSRASHRPGAGITTDQMRRRLGLKRSRTRKYHNA